MQAVVRGDGDVVVEAVKAVLVSLWFLRRDLKSPCTGVGCLKNTYSWAVLLFLLFHLARTSLCKISGFCRVFTDTPEDSLLLGAGHRPGEWGSAWGVHWLFTYTWVLRFFKTGHYFQSYGTFKFSSSGALFLCLFVRSLFSSFFREKWRMEGQFPRFYVHAFSYWQSIVAAIQWLVLDNLFCVVKLVFRVINKTKLN